MFARSDLGAAHGQGLNSPGVYVLLGDDPDEAYDRQIYVGQAEDVGKRLKQHQGDDNKDFWDTTIAFLSGNQSLNRAHTSFLEAELTRLARSAGRVRVANGNAPSVPYMPAADHAVAAGFLAEMRAIFPVLGVDAFEAPEPKPVTAAVTRFFLDARGSKGEGEERSDGFLVFKGATARLDDTPSLAASGSSQRARLVNSGRLQSLGTHYLLTDDTLFKTPSAAALVLTGAHVNGREAWRDASGVTLKDHQIAQANGAS